MLDLYQSHLDVSGPSPLRCENNLEITGPRRVVKSFIRRNTRRDNGLLSFNKLIPAPYYVKNHYNKSKFSRWAAESWGSSTDTFLSFDIKLGNIYEEDDDSLRVVLNFHTQYAAPSVWLAVASKKYRRLTFKLWFDEPELEGSGAFYYDGGRLNIKESWKTERSYLKVKCAVKSCYARLSGLSAKERQVSLGGDVSTLCCAEHKFYQAVLEGASS